MATVTWKAEKQTFNPEKNYFNIDYVKLHYEETEWEVETKRKENALDLCGWLLGIFFCIVAFFGCITFGALEMWLAFWILFPTSLVCATLSFRVLCGISAKYCQQLKDYYKENPYWETCPEALELKAYNEEQERIAEAWRAEHPFEEHIRTCIKDPNSSVAIAEAAKYYAENYLNKEN